MMEFSLTQRERELLIQLVSLSQRSKDHFEAWIVDPTAEAGPTRELARLDFGAEGASMELTKRDLRVLKDEGFIHFRWDFPNRGTGRLSSLALEAVKHNFANSDPGAAAALEEAANKRSVLADQKAIALRFEKITNELVTLASHLIVPDETVLIRKIKGFVSRLSLTFSGTADLAMKGAMIGEFGERLAAWLVALSVWTEWHAAHHEAPDPCA